jgi:5S rRNA maturation endonuclease (ribonuclease M5)
MKPFKRLKNSAKAERDEKVQLVLEALIQKARDGALILVEGSRDVEALRRLGVEGNFFRVKAGKPLKESIAYLAESPPGEIVILTDFDRGGVRLARMITRLLELQGIHPNLDFWLKLRGLIGREIKDVEGLAGYLENVKRKLFHVIS